MRYIVYSLPYIVVVIAIIATSFFVEIELNEVKCDKRWENSGLDTSYTFWGGCQVRLSSGKWIPEDRVRQSDIVTDYED